MTVLEMKVEALMKCVDQEKFEKAMLEVGVMTFGTANVDTDRMLRHEIQNIMVQIGVPAHVRGYRMLAYGLEITVKNETVIDNMTKEFYPAVAEQFNTTPSRVERAMRHAIELAWDRGDWHLLQQYFGSSISKTKCKPTNTEFIARLANIIRDRLR